MARDRAPRYEREATMSESAKKGPASAIKVPAFLRDRLEGAQVRLVHLEEEVQRTLKELVQKGRASRKDLEAMIAKLSKDQRLTGLRGRLEKLQRTGAVRAEEIRGKAETIRADALERIVDFQGKAVSFLGVATREQVAELQRELDRLARRLEKREKARPSKGSGKAGT
jgi:hypothetical protein